MSLPYIPFWRDIGLELPIGLEVLSLRGLQELNGGTTNMLLLHLPALTYSLRSWWQSGATAATTRDATGRPRVNRARLFVVAGYTPASRDFDD
jgi:hypothetical protein